MKQKSQEHALKNVESYLTKLRKGDILVLTDEETWGVDQVCQHHSQVVKATSEGDEHLVFLDLCKEVAGKGKEPVLEGSYSTFYFVVGLVLGFISFGTLLWTWRMILSLVEDKETEVLQEGKSISNGKGKGHWYCMRVHQVWGVWVLQRETMDILREPVSFRI